MRRVALISSAFVAARRRCAGRRFRLAREPRRHARPYVLLCDLSARWAVPRRRTSALRNPAARKVGEARLRRRSLRELRPGHRKHACVGDVGQADGHDDRRARLRGLRREDVRNGRRSARRMSCRRGADPAHASGLTRWRGRGTRRRVRVPRRVRSSCASAPCLPLRDVSSKVTISLRRTPVLEAKLAVRTAAGKPLAYAEVRASESEAVRRTRMHGRLMRARRSLTSPPRPTARRIDGDE